MNLNWFTNGNRGVSTRLNKRCQDYFDRNYHTQYQNGYENRTQYEEIKNGFCGDVTDEIHQGSSKSLYGLPYMSRKFRNMLHEPNFDTNKQKYEKEYKAYNLLNKLNTQKTLQEDDIKKQIKVLKAQYEKQEQEAESFLNANLGKLSQLQQTQAKKKRTDHQAEKQKQYDEQVQEIKNNKKRKEFISSNEPVDDREIITHTSIYGGSRRRRSRHTRRTGGLRRRSRRN